MPRSASSSASTWAAPSPTSSSSTPPPAPSASPRCRRPRRTRPSASSPPSTQAGVDLAESTSIVHGTTTTTNAVLERRLARTGLITTQGFRDVLELGRRTRPHPYGMTGRFTPVIPRDLRLEVPERIDARGRILTPLDEPATRAAVAQLLAQGCESLVIHFLHAYANPAHELRAAAIAAELWPNPHITIGHSLLSESREYERGVTAAVNAAVQPLLERYVARLQSELTARGYARDLLVVTGNGGMVSARLVAREAAKTVMSGPASGVMAAIYTARRAGIANLITYDMGGTSTDVALIRGGAPAISNEIELEYAMPIHVPMVDVRTVGAGGGSIARVNAAGLLEVGPASAGAEPGPIATGRGGTAPHHHRRQPPPRPPRPRPLPRRRPRPRRIFAETLGRPLGLTPEAAAAAVLRIADTRMANAIRMVSLSLGADPRDFTLFAFGGAGPLHAAALARELGIPRVLVPARPGITNALGCVVADLRHDFVRTLSRPLAALDIAEVHAILAAQEAEGRALIAAAPVAATAVTASFAADMQFVGQTHLLRVPLARRHPDPRRPPVPLRGRLPRPLPRRPPRDPRRPRQPHLLGHRPPPARRPRPPPRPRRPPPHPRRSPDRHPPGPVRRRLARHPRLPPRPPPPAATLAGPAILEQMDTTTVLPPGDRAQRRTPTATSSSTIADA